MTPLRLLAPLLAASLLAACSGTPAPPAAEPAPTPQPAVHLALGDSVAAGVGAGDPATGGYVPLLAERLRERLPALRVQSLAVSGATTSTVLRDQVPRAAARLREDPAVRLVTLTVGGNDVFGPVLLACLGDPAGPSCRTAVDEALAGADAGLDAVLGALDEAAGDGTVLAVMTYYDPLPACRLAALAPLAGRVLEGGEGGRGLNDLLRARAAEHDAVVVETADRVADREDLVGGQDCLHPSGRGHAQIAEAFDAALQERLPA